MVMPLADEGPDLPTSRHNKTDGTPPPKPFGFVMSHQQENRFILPSPILFVGNSVSRQQEKGKQNRVAQGRPVKLSAVFHSVILSGAKRSRKI